MKMIKADEEMQNANAKHSYFEFLVAQVDVITKEMGVIQKILKQNNMVLKSEESADTDIESTTWKVINKSYKRK